MPAGDHGRDGGGGGAGMFCVVAVCGKRFFEHCRKSSKVLTWAEFPEGGRVGAGMPHGENSAPAEFGACVQ